MAPEDLSPGQAFYPVSILPSPKRSHFNQDGTLRTGWLRMLERLMDIARQRGHLTEEEAASLETSPPKLGVPAKPESLGNDSTESAHLTSVSDEPIRPTPVDNLEREGELVQEGRPLRGEPRN